MLRLCCAAEAPYIQLTRAISLKSHVQPAYNNNKHPIIYLVSYNARCIKKSDIKRHERKAILYQATTYIYSYVF